MKDKAPEDNQYFLVIDLEATCNKEPPLPADQMETIEVGAVLVDVKKKEPVGTFRRAVWPVRIHNVTPFCTELTGLTKEDLYHAPDFGEVMEELDSWLCEFTDPEAKVAWGSWGNFDDDQIKQDSVRHKVESTKLGTHCNLKKMFSKQNSVRKYQGLQGALYHSDMLFEGKLHTALDDAKNVARLIYNDRLAINKDEIHKYSRAKQKADAEGVEA